MANLYEFLDKLIEGGFIGQAVLGTLVWGSIAYLSIAKGPIDDRLWSAGLVILGYFFHMVQSAALARKTSELNKVRAGCDDDSETP